MPLLRGALPLKGVARPRIRTVDLLVCWSCRLQPVTRREFRSSVRRRGEKPYYVTTPIFYVNAAPHIGHAHSMVLADVYRRWEELKGNVAIACTGTDEHGLKVQQSALLADTSPEDLCDVNAQKFQALADLFMGPHDFIRTTDAKHVNAVGEFWRMLNERGLIYESRHTGWYSVQDECFYPADMIERSTHPWTGKLLLVAGGPNGSGNPVEWIEEKNYHFRLTAFKDRLLALYEQNPDWVTPRTRMNELVDWVENHLEDLSISRPRDRLTWGIPVPDDPSQTIYVWVDALINYITNSGFPNWTPEAMKAGGWPADLQIIGKDILRFHGVYWPALLMALDLPLPKRLLGHAHWTLEKRKISKSAGNGVDPQLVVERLGIDTVRWFLMKRGAIQDDASWDNSLVALEYRSFLSGQYGNLLSRVLRQKNWDVRETITFMKEHGGGTDETFKDLVELAKLADQVEEQMAAARPDRALGLIAKTITDANRYISDAAPWKSTDEAGNRMDPAVVRERARPVIYRVAETLRICSILLQPFIPDKAALALNMLGVSADCRSFKHASTGRDTRYGSPEPGYEFRKGAQFSLFPPLDIIEPSVKGYSGDSGGESQGSG